VTAVDRGERNPAVAVAISKGNPGKPMKGQFWRGGESKDKGCTTTLGGDFRRRSSSRRRGAQGKERRKVNQQLHAITNRTGIRKAVPQASNSHGGLEWSKG